MADEDCTKKFSDEKRPGTVAAFFAELIVFIFCPELTRTGKVHDGKIIKDIGRSKVPGASVRGITALLSEDFLTRVIIPFIIGIIVCVWFMSIQITSNTSRHLQVFAGCGR